MNDYHLDPPDDLEPPEWFMMIEDALNEPRIPESVATVVRKALDDWCNTSPYEDYFPPPEEPTENTCRTCGKPTNCIYCSEECSPPCPHGKPWGSCDACDHISDLAYDAARERR